MNAEQLITPAVLAFMVYGGGLPDLRMSVAESIMRSWRVDIELIQSLALCGYPSRVENIVLAGEIAKRYGDVSTVPGFYRHRECWFMDLDEKYCETGFVMPIRDTRHKWIGGLVAFRNARDMRGFPFVVRRERKAIA